MLLEPPFTRTLLAGCWMLPLLGMCTANWGAVDMRKFTILATELKARADLFEAKLEFYCSGALPSVPADSARVAAEVRA
jgi:hypothetical protein